MRNKGKQAFLRSYGPVMAVVNTPEELPPGIPVNRIWTEIDSVDTHALAAGIWQIDAVRYLVMLRPWVPDWVMDRPGWQAAHGPFWFLGSESCQWIYPGIAADTASIISAEGPLRINGHGDIPA